MPNLFASMSNPYPGPQDVGNGWSLVQSFDFDTWLINYYWQNTTGQQTRKFVYPPFGGVDVSGPSDPTRHNGYAIVTYGSVDTGDYRELLTDGYGRTYPGIHAGGMIKWNGRAGDTLYVQNAAGAWDAVGAPPHAESASYVMQAVDDPQIEKLIRLRNADPSLLDNEQRAFFAGGIASFDSFGQGYRWGRQNLFDNVFDAQQAATLLQTGYAAYLSAADRAAGQAFIQEQSAAAQAARSKQDQIINDPVIQAALLAASAYGVYSTVTNFMGTLAVPTDSALSALDVAQFGTVDAPLTIGGSSIASTPSIADIVQALPSPTTLQNAANVPPAAPIDIYTAPVQSLTPSAPTTGTNIMPLGQDSFGYDSISDALNIDAGAYTYDVPATAIPDAASPTGSNWWDFGGNTSGAYDPITGEPIQTVSTYGSSGPNAYDVGASSLDVPTFQATQTAVNAAVSGAPVSADIMAKLKAAGIDINTVKTVAGAVFKFVAQPNGTYTAQAVNAQAQQARTQAAQSKTFVTLGLGALALLLLR